MMLLFFSWPIHKLDGVPPFEMLLQCSAGFVLAGDVDFDVFRMMLLAAIAAIDKCFLRPDLLPVNRSV